MYPTLYLYQPKDAQFKLYLGEYDTLHGLKMMPFTARIEKLELGASGYQKLGWATEKDIPACKTVGDLSSFFEQEGDINLIQFEVEIEGGIRLSTHDDGECYFTFSQKKKAIQVLRAVIPHSYQDKLLAALLKNPGKYISVDPLGNLNVYHPFDQYLQATSNR